VSRDRSHPKPEIFHPTTPYRYTVRVMDVEQTIAEIEWLERSFAAPDNRPLTPSDLSAANRRHDQAHAHSPWFRLWQSYGVCCRPDPAILRLPQT